jgi:hypothetical protein
MSRSFTRGLFVAPLLATALLLSACGGDDSTDDGAAIPVTPAATTPTDLSTTPSTPAEATPEATPADGEEKKGGDDDAGPTPAPQESTDAPEEASAPTPTPNQAEAPGKLRPSADRAQNEVLRALTAIETCFTTTSSYKACSSAERVNGFGANAVDSKNPKPTEVAITRATKSTFKIVGTDKAGTRWVLTKFKSGDVTRKCRRKNGDVCNPSTW